MTSTTAIPTIVPITIMKTLKKLWSWLLKVGLSVRLLGLC
jgi:hypothetical protein